LQGAGDVVGITVIGSSYTNKNTGYPDGIRYTLQRDLLDISIQVDKGPWVGMEEYLRDDAFRSNKPKLIIWEIPERELRSPPNAKFRDARYQIDNNEWISRIAALLK
jgi:alginate O-acetyltransferase complex protein AlgJ